MSRFIYPVQAPLSQGFGENPDYYRKFGQIGHNGQDWACPINTPVKAAADGVVFFEGFGENSTWMRQPAGICIILDHGDIYTGYAHLNTTIVNAGQRVIQGQIIGYSGATGAATGSHLHFEFIGKPPVLTNGYYGRINPTLVEQGATGGTQMTDRPTLDVIYAGVLGRPRGNGEGEDVYLNKDTNWVIKDVYNSQEANIRRSQLAAQNAAVAQLQQSVSDLSTRPTKAELDKVVQDSTTNLQTIQELQKQLEDAKNTPPVVVEKVVEVEKPSRWTWLTNILDSILNNK